MLLKIKKYHVDPTEVVEMYPEEAEKTLGTRKIISYILTLELKSGNIKKYEFDTADERDRAEKSVLNIRNKEK